MTDVLVSYARSTEARAQQIASTLRQLGYEVWVDDQLPVHVEYRKLLAERIEAAKAVVVLWSAEALESDWVCSEAERARKQRKLVQLSLDGVLPPMPFDQIQSANLVGWNGDLDAPAWRKVVSSIADLVAGPAPVVSKARTVANRLPSEPLLAVLAFDNLSGDPEMIYFSDGVSEEIQQTVARSNGLKVIGRGSSFSFRGSDKAASNVARQLRATHVLDGSVRRSGTRVRISAQLVACDSETTLWSERFDREMTDIFALQDEIASAVSAALKTTFTPLGRARSIDPDVYDLYLKARATTHWTTGEHEDHERRVLERLTMLERVVGAAPWFARAWAAVAWDRAFYLRNFDRRRVPGLSRDSVVDAAENALRLDPGAGVAYLALSRLEPWGHYLKREARRRQGLAVLPNDPFVLTDLAWFCWDVGRLREALQYAQRAWELDPMDHRAADAYATTLDELGRSSEARVLWDDFCERWPHSVAFAAGAIRCAALQDDWDRFESRVAAAGTRGIRVERIVEYRRNVRSPDPHYMGRYLPYTQEILIRTGRVPLQLLAGLSQLGMLEQAFQLVDKASFAHLFDPDGASPTEGDVGVGVAILFQRENWQMMRDIRFVGLCAKLGLGDYWIETNRWPDCADEVSYDFKAEARRWRTQT